MLQIEVPLFKVSAIVDALLDEVNLHVRSRNTSERVKPLQGTAFPFVLDAAVVAITPRDLKWWLPDLIEGGVDAIMVTVGVLEGCQEVVEDIAEWLVEIGSEKYPIRLATTVAELRAAKRDGQIAIGFSFQGGQPFEHNLKLVDVYARLGLRVVQLTYNHGNLIGDGCFEERDAG